MTKTIKEFNKIMKLSIDEKALRNFRKSRKQVNEIVAKFFTCDEEFRNNLVLKILDWHFKEIYREQKKMIKEMRK